MRGHYHHAKIKYCRALVDWVLKLRPGKPLRVMAVTLSVPSVRYLALFPPRAAVRGALGAAAALQRCRRGR